MNTPLLALEVSDAVQLVLANGVILILTMVVKDWIDKQRAREIKAESKARNDATAKKLDDVVGNVAAMGENVQKIETATNNMKDQLVLKTEAEALSRGGVEERARADERAAKGEAGTNL